MPRPPIETDQTGALDARAARLEEVLPQTRAAYQIAIDRHRLAAAQMEWERHDRVQMVVVHCAEAVAKSVRAIGARTDVGASVQLLLEGQAKIIDEMAEQLAHAIASPAERAAALERSRLELHQHDHRRKGHQCNGRRG